MPRLNLGRNMAAMNKMLAKHNAKVPDKPAKQLVPLGSTAGSLKTGSRQSLRSSVEGSQRLLGKSGGALSESTKKSGGKKKEKKSIDQMGAEVAAKNTEYEAGKMCMQKLKELEGLVDEMAHVKRLIDRKRPNPLGSYTAKDFLKIFAINNFVLLVFGFFFASAIYSVFPGDGFQATSIIADGLDVVGKQGGDGEASQNLVVRSTADNSQVLMKGPGSAGVAFGKPNAEDPSFNLKVTHRPTGPTALVLFGITAER